MTRLCLAIVLSASWAGLATGQTLPAVAPAAEAVQGRMNPRPRVSDGKNFSLELRGKFQGDSAWFDPVVADDDTGFTWRRRRLAIRGEFFKRIDVEVEREFGDDAEPWRDVYANVRLARLLEIRGGKFKAPFGLDNLTGSTTHDFIFRSLGTRTLVPGREVGGMVHGALRRDRLTYAFGVFNAEAPASSATTDGFFDDDQGGDSFDRVLSGRVTARPLDAVKSLPDGLRHLELGLSAAKSTVPVGKNGLKGKSVFGYDFFSRVFVNGDRLQTGADVTMMAGPASLKAEWIRSTDERLSQGVGDVDLSKAFGSGWYVAGTWLVTGEKKDGNVTPKRPLLQGGLGAIEFTARLERMLFGSNADSSFPASTNPRGENLARNQDTVTTLGLSWYLNRWIKLQGNVINESFLDPARAPIAGTASYRSYVTRLQFAF